MNKQELIEKYKELENGTFDIAALVVYQLILKDLEQLDELETGHADEAPRYVKNILARLRELPLHDREVWLKAIMGEFEQDFSHAKWREGYEQGKLEGAWVGNQLKDADKIRQELNKPVIPQFVADWIDESKKHCKNVVEFFKYKYPNTEMIKWIESEKRFDLIARAWLDGYEVEKEKRYRVKLKSNSKEIDYLVNTERNGLRFYSTIYTQRREHTRKEIEDAGFGWIFSCEGIEVEEVE